MKQTVTLNIFRNSFESTRAFNFSRDALEALFFYLVQMEEDTGQEQELDVIAICCDYSEQSYEDVLNEYVLDIDVEGDDKQALREAVITFLEENTTVVRALPNSVVYQNF